MRVHWVIVDTDACVGMADSISYSANVRGIENERGLWLVQDMNRDMYKNAGMMSIRKYFLAMTWQSAENISA